MTSTTLKPSRATPELPFDTIETVFTYLDPRTTCTALTVCREWSSKRHSYSTDELLMNQSRKDRVENEEPFAREYLAALGGRHLNLRMFSFGKTLHPTEDIEIAQNLMRAVSVLNLQTLSLSENVPCSALKILAAALKGEQVRVRTLLLCFPPVHKFVCGNFRIPRLSSAHVTSLEFNLMATLRKEQTAEIGQNFPNVQTLIINRDEAGKYKIAMTTLVKTLPALKSIEVRQPGEALASPLTTEKCTDYLSELSTQPKLSFLDYVTCTLSPVKRSLTLTR
ncbi:MAG: hypothetical protein HYX48_06575 [Chlamydiales bacterium]|nr:hypothetical protein [Chlamydiales bacterium]